MKEDQEEDPNVKWANSVTPEEIEAISVKNKIDNHNLEFDKLLAGNAEQDYFSMYLELRDKYFELEDEIEGLRAKSDDYKDELAKYMVDAIATAKEDDRQEEAKWIIRNLL